MQWATYLVKTKDPQTHHPPSAHGSSGSVFLGPLRAERPDSREQLRRGMPAVLDGGPHTGRHSYELGFVGPVSCAAHAG